MIDPNETGNRSGRETTVDPDDVARFSALADLWWDPKGPFRPLHKFNPARLTVIRDLICAHAGRDADRPSALAGLQVLDIGCGGGLVCEPLARLGADVTGIDASEKNIGTARAHALRAGLDRVPTYLATTAEDLADQGVQFDVVLTLEVLEHVADRALFVRKAAQLTRPGGLLIAATLNRTTKAYALAIIGAEYVLGWLPRGTHDWKRFITPDELDADLRGAGLTPESRTGFTYSPLSDRWRATNDLSVNYLISATRPDA